MRQHRCFAQLAPRYDIELFTQVVKAEHLLAARVDPGFSTRTENLGLLDLVFARDDRIVVVPFLTASGLSLISRDRSPFAWPAWLPPLRSAVAQSIEEAVEPWLQSLVLGRCLNTEAWRCFGSEREREVVETARTYGFLGAAPTEMVLCAMAPYVYALRFAAGRHVAVADGDGASGTAVLARVAASVATDLGDEKRARLACRWFGLDVFGGGGSGVRADLSISKRDRTFDAPMRIVLDAALGPDEREVLVAAPTPPAGMVSFDPADAAASGRFAVTVPATAARPNALREMPIVGGGTGRIGLVVRDDYRTADDADVDAARALEARLAEQGFTPALVGVSHVRPEDVDLLHIVGRGCAPQLKQRFERGELTGIRIVITPNMGAEVPVDDAALRTLVARADAAIATCDEEEEQLREAFGFRGAVRKVPALLGPEPAVSDISAAVGDREFVLVHAPVERRSNQLPFVQAAAMLGYPIVLTGPVLDVDYYIDVMASLGDAAMWVPSESLTTAETAALYARARVFADVSQPALLRPARAGAFGAALVASRSSYARSVWPGLVQLAGPEPESVAAALQAAWERAPELGPATAQRTADACDPFASLVNVLALYQAPVPV